SMYIPYLMTFYFNYSPPPALYTLSLHDALPIYRARAVGGDGRRGARAGGVDEIEAVDQPAAPHRRCLAGARLRPRPEVARQQGRDRKSTRLNSSHSQISYAVFCLKKKKKEEY